MTGSGREALPNVRKWLGDLLDVRVVGRLSQMSGSGWETLSDDR